MSAADEIAKLEARVASLRADLDEATRVIGQFSIVLGEHGKLLRQIDARLRGIDGGGPEPVPAPVPAPAPVPVPVPPPSPVPAPVPSPVPAQRSAADVTAIIQAEFAAATTYRLNESQLAAWVRYFMDPAMAALTVEPFKAAVRAMVEKDINQYKWPRAGIPAPTPAPNTPTAADTFHIVVSGESS